MAARRRDAAALQAEHVRLKARSLEECDEELVQHNAAEELQQVPIKTRLGWRRDSEAYGWFGGSISQLEYIDCQHETIQQLKRELGVARRAVQNTAKFNRSQRGGAILDQRATPGAAPAAQRLAHCRATQVEPQVQAQPPAPASVVAVSAARKKNNTSAELVAALSKQRQQMEELVRQLAAERACSNEAAQALAKAEVAREAACDRHEKDTAKIKRHLEALQDENVGLRAERDQLQWLLRRANPSPPRESRSARGRAAQDGHLCPSCGRRMDRRSNELHA
jgi:hypothetical protein